MRANTIWGFIGIAVASFILWAQSVGTAFGKQWAPWMWVAIGVSAIGAILAWLWPRIRRSRDFEGESHELALYNADPAIQAFRDARAKDIADGKELRDMPLGTLFLLLVTQTAWGRWQARQYQVPLPVQLPITNKQFLRIAESYLLTQLEQGRLAARGFYKGRRDDIRFISPDWWGFVYFEVVEDAAQIYKASIKPRHEVDPAVCKKFTSISCELGRFFALFPKQDDPPPEALEPAHQ